MRLPHPGHPSDSQWHSIQPLLPLVKSGGRPRTLDMSLVVNASLYLVVGGHPMADAPKEYPKWQSVYYYFWMWCEAPKGHPTWQRIHNCAR
jgi:transposase